jgi:hypothetical protein
MSTANPDPSTLTTDALRRDIGALQHVVESRLKCLEEVIILKTDAITGLKEVKFQKVQQQFDLLERARLEQKSDTAQRVDAALTAQKEAAAKSEESFTKQIDAQKNLMESHHKSTDDKIAALTVRVSVKDGSGNGIREIIGYILALAALALAFYRH